MTTRPFVSLASLVALTMFQTAAIPAATAQAAVVEHRLPTWVGWLMIGLGVLMLLVMAIGAIIHQVKKCSREHFKHY